MASVTFRDGFTVDDTSGPNGLASGGHRLRFVPALSHAVDVALESKNWASLLGTIVFDNEYSAKEYSVGTTAPLGSAKQWASGNQIIGGLKSAKAYSEDSLAKASESAASALAASNSQIASAASASNSSVSAQNSANSASAALVSQQQAAISASSAASSLAATLAAAGLSGAKAYASRALATADFANLTNNQVVFIAVDEANGNQGTYNRASGTPVTSLVFLRFHEYYTSPSTAVPSDSVQNTLTKLLVATGAIPVTAPSLTLGA